MFDNLIKKFSVNQLSPILLKVFQIDEVSINLSYHISAEYRLLHFQISVALISECLYMSKMYDIVNDASKFLKFSSDPTLRREGKLQRFLSILKNKDFFTKEQHDNIDPCGS